MTNTETITVFRILHAEHYEKNKPHAIGVCEAFRYNYISWQMHLTNTTFPLHTIARVVTSHFSLC